MNQSSNLITITHGPESSLTKSMFQKYIMDKYPVGGPSEIVSKNENIFDILDEKFSFNTVHKFKSLDGFRETIVIEIETAALILEYSIIETRISFFGVSLSSVEKLYSEVYDIISNLKTPKDVCIVLHSYFLESGRIDSSVNEFFIEDFQDLDDRYFPDFESTNEFFRQFIVSKEKICVLSGTAGTGKSKLAKSFLKYVINNKDSHKLLNATTDIETGTVYIHMGYLSDERLLSFEGFWKMLEDEWLSAVIMDDIDTALMARKNEVVSELEEQQNKIMSFFLSSTDGIQENTTKFFITTNRLADDFDPAILRKGRLFDILELSPFKREEALKIWLDEGLSLEDFIVEFGEDDGFILQADLASLIYEYSYNDKVKPKSFLKADSKASVLQSKKIKKRVGFDIV